MPVKILDERPIKKKALVGLAFSIHENCKPVDYTEISESYNSFPALVQRGREPKYQTVE